MIKKIVELDSDTMSQNVWDRTNRFMKKRIMLRYRDAILMQIGEGPWKKTYLPRNTPKQIKVQVMEQLKKQWPDKRIVVVDVSVRRPRRFDGDNHVGGMKPLWDGFQWAGWCVTDHVRWLRRVIRPQYIGDPKTVMEIFVPESEKEEHVLLGRFDGKGL